VVDHHEWNSELINRLRSLSVEFYIDRSSCATGVVARCVKLMKEGTDTKFIENLVEGVCGGKYIEIRLFAITVLHETC